MEKAEVLYNEKKELSQELYMKFIIKKASMLKKYGFFHKSIEMLRGLEK